MRKKALDAALGAAYDGSLDQQVAAIPSLIAHLGHEDADLALLYLLQHPWNTGPILEAGCLLLSNGSDQALRLFAVAWHLTEVAEEWSGADTLCDAVRAGEASGINVVRWASLVEGSSPAANAGAQSICEWLTGGEQLPG